MKKLRGARGTPVRFRCAGVVKRADSRRTGSRRNQIPTVPAIHDRPDHGLRAAARFRETTDRDLRRALQSLTSKGMRQLLLDIRNNPGGPLDQAIKVVNEFTTRGKMIVYTAAGSRIRIRTIELRRRRVHEDSDRDDGEPQQCERL